MDYRLVIVRAGKRDMTDKQAFTIAFDAFSLGGRELFALFLPELGQFTVVRT